MGKKGHVPLLAFSQHVFPIDDCSPIVAVSERPALLAYNCILIVARISISDVVKPTSTHAYVSSNFYWRGLSSTCRITTSLKGCLPGSELSLARDLVRRCHWVTGFAACITVSMSNGDEAGHTICSLYAHLLAWWWLISRSECFRRLQRPLCWIELTRQPIGRCNSFQ